VNVNFVCKDGRTGEFAVPGASISRAIYLTGFNDAGVVVGYYGVAAQSAEFYGFIATPVLEPSTIPVVGSRLIGLLGLGKKLKK